MRIQFPQMQQEQMIHMQEHFEGHCDILPAFGFNIGKAIWTVFWFKNELPIFVENRDVIKKANQCVIHVWRRPSIGLTEVWNKLPSLNP